jgi:hypothetical protein
MCGGDPPLSQQSTMGLHPCADQLRVSENMHVRYQQRDASINLVYTSAAATPSVFGILVLDISSVHGHFLGGGETITSPAISWAHVPAKAAPSSHIPRHASPSYCSPPPVLHRSSTSSTCPQLPCHDSTLRSCNNSACRACPPPCHGASVLQLQ